MEFNMNRYKDIFERLGQEDHLVYKMEFPDKCSGETKDIKRSIIEDEDILLGGVPEYLQEVGIYYEPFYKRERMIILGAGHVAVFLSMMAKMIGFYVVVVDDRADFADTNRFPYADEVVCDVFDRAIRGLKPTAHDYVVIITRGHAHDAECIEALFKYDEPIYTGLIGSRRRVAMVFEGLKAKGLDAERLGRICTPIGLNIGAKTIEEIDISIMAEIIKRRRVDSAGTAYVDRADHDFQSLVQLSQITKPCAIATILSDKGSTPRSAGASMAIFMDGTTIGSIGGGCMEGAIMHKAKTLVGTGKYEIVNVSLDGTDAMIEGMVCGGSAKVLIEDIS